MISNLGNEIKVPGINDRGTEVQKLVCFRLCTAEDDVRGHFDKVSQVKGTLTKAIRTAAMNTLVPYVKVSRIIWIGRVDATYI